MIYDPSLAKFHPVEVILDECTDVNWITEHLVEQLHLGRPSDAIPVTHHVVTGEEFTSSQLAAANWLDKNKKIAQGEFYVLPQASPVDRIILGKRAINRWKGGLLDDNPEDSKPVYWTGQNLKTVGRHPS